MSGHVTLDLPEPPSRNKIERLNWRAKRGTIRRYKADVWAAACEQVRPSPEPPAAAVIDAHLRLWNPRDPTNLEGDMKYVLDALKQRPATNDNLRWRDGIYIMRGYFIDDDQVTWGTVTQEVDRGRRGVTVTIRPVPERTP